MHDSLLLPRTLNGVECVCLCLCVCAVAKARAIFEPFLHQLGQRLSHVLRQMQPATMYMLQVGSEPSCVSLRLVASQIAEIEDKISCKDAVRVRKRGTGKKR